MILLPEEAMTLFPQHHGVYLAAMLGVAVCPQLAHDYTAHYGRVAAAERFALVPADARAAWQQRGCIAWEKLEKGGRQGSGGRGETRRTRLACAVLAWQDGAAWALACGLA